MTLPLDYEYRGFRIALRLLLEGWGAEVIGLHQCHTEGHPDSHAALETVKLCIDRHLQEQP